MKKIKGTPAASVLAGGISRHMFAPTERQSIPVVTADYLERTRLAAGLTCCADPHEAEQETAAQGEAKWDAAMKQACEVGQ